MARAGSIHNKQHEDIVQHQQHRSSPQAASDCVLHRGNNPHKVKLRDNGQKINVLKALGKVERDVLVHIREDGLKINVRIVAQLIRRNMMQVVAILVK
jgi:hypothetical protein